MMRLLHLALYLNCNALVKKLFFSRIDMTLLGWSEKVYHRMIMNVDYVSITINELKKRNYRIYEIL